MQMKINIENNDKKKTKIDSKVKHRSTLQFGNRSNVTKQKQTKY